MKKVIISRKVKEYRLKNNMSQTSFGTLFGVSAQTVSKWEHDKCYPDVTIFPDIAEILGCSVDDFFE